jgi:DNA mismatch endonuclease (patch repair protein)
MSKNGKSFKPNSKEVSNRMSKIKSRNTRLEEAMEESLTEIGVPFVKQPKMTGHPDFKLKECNLVIFCDSSFWHGRNPEDVSGKNFKRNRDLWVEKLTKTKQRDRRVNMELRKHGYKVLRFWDDEILKSPEAVKKVIRENLEWKGSNQ